VGYVDGSGPIYVNRPNLEKIETSKPERKPGSLCLLQKKSVKVLKDVCVLRWMKQN